MHRSILLAALALHAAPALAAASASAAPIPASSFFGRDHLHASVLSPDGRMLALITQPEGKRKGVVLVDLATMQRRELARYEVGDVGMVRWLNEGRLSFSVVNLPEDMLATSSGLYAVNADGSKLKGVSPSLPRLRSFAADETAGSYDDGRTFFGIGAQRTADMFVILAYLDGNELGYINTRDLQVRRMHIPPDSQLWGIDEKDRVKVALTTAGTETVVHYKPLLMWNRIASFKKNSEQDFTPIMYSSEGLYVRAYKGQDKAAIYRYDLERAALADKPLLASHEVDMIGSMVTNDKSVIGFRPQSGSRDTIWFDASMKAVQAEVDALLPTLSNRVEQARRSTTPFFLVESSSSTEPGIAYIYNRETKKLHEMGRDKPDIDAARMLPTRRETYTTRDGRKLAVNVTLAHSAVAGKNPAVVLLPTMPWDANAAQGWDARVQFLASRGYTVIEPEARGTRGYGRAALEAGRRQWGLGIQDDIADSAKWAATQGYADPARMCAVGRAYGGYAALMGVTRDKDLFRCAVSISGIVDLGTMYSASWTGASAASDGYSVAEMVGDPVADREQFVATSPLHQVSRISRPVFLAYGARDSILPLKHGEPFYEALKASSPLSELHVYDREEARSSPDENRIDLWTRVEAFLGKHIGSR